MKYFFKLLFLNTIVLASLAQMTQEPSSEFVPSSKWAKIQERTQNAVVQIVVLSIEFDWAQPYNMSRQKMSRGSGFFINDRGDIVTNFHVVKEAVAVWMHIPALGKQQIKLNLRSVCPSRDIALLSIDEQDVSAVHQALGSIPYLTLANSDEVYKKRSEKVLAIGYPLGQESLKTTMGVISGFEIEGIQIDAAVNPGNSGGPLLNDQGKVIGINNSGYKDAQNVNYAIPANELSSILDDLYANLIVHTPTMGEISIYSNDVLAQYQGNPVESAGCYILKVIEGSPFDNAGIKEGDMLYAIDGNKVDKYGDMHVSWANEPISYEIYVRRLSIRALMDVEYYRDGNLEKVTIDLSQSCPQAIVKKYAHLDLIEYEVIAGMVIMPLTMNHIELFQRHCECLKWYRLPDNQKEPVLIISHLFSNSSIGRSKIVGSGFTITTVNGVPVKTLDQFRDALQTSWQMGYLVMTVADQQHGFSDNIPVIVPFYEALQETVHLSSLYGYPISSAVHTLLEKSGYAVK